jgi:hypothetical protein
MGEKIYTVSIQLINTAVSIFLNDFAVMHVSYTRPSRLLAFTAITSILVSFGA